MRRLLVISLYLWLALAGGSNVLVLLVNPRHTFAALLVATITVSFIARGVAWYFPPGPVDDAPDDDDPDACAWPEPSVWRDAA